MYVLFPDMYFVEHEIEFWETPKVKKTKLICNMI